MSARFRLPKSRMGATLSFVGLSAIAGILATVAVTPAIAMTGAAANSSIGMFENLPTFLRVDNLPQKTTVYAHRTIDGQDQNVEIASFYAENRESVGWDQVAQVAKDAAVAAEDPRYYEHGGVDPLGVVRAAISNVMGGDVQGASTITQQYVKNVLVAQATGLATEEERAAAYEEATGVSFDRKLKEMRYAIAIEKEFSKDDILLGYLNIALYGGRVYGIQAAAQYYYGVNASDLSLNQATSLLAIVNNPANLRLDMPDDPDNGAANGYALTKERRDYVLDSMLEHGKIDQATHDATIAEPIEPSIHDDPVGCGAAGNAGFFCNYVVNVIQNNDVFGASEEERYNNFIRGGYDVYTTLDLDMQDTAQASIDENVPKTRVEGVDLASAASAVEAGTGKIKVMAQNKDFNEAGDAQGENFSAVNYNADRDYGASSGFQAASTYKVFTLIAWLRAGHTLGESLNISEKDYDYSTFRTSCAPNEGGSGYVENDANERGNRTVLQSTETSINGGFMQMGQQLDQCEIRRAATDLGVHRADGAELTVNPGAILGTNEVAPVTMAAAYAGIANHGGYCSPIAIERMVKPDGSDATIPQSECRQAIEAPVADAASYALQTVIESGSATASNPYDGIEHIAKTGTTDANTNTWTTGASSKIGLSVLVGQANPVSDTENEYANLRELYLDSGRAAEARHRIWNPIMTALDERFGGDDFTQPESRFLRGVQISVPDVTGQTLDQARSIIEGAGFTFADGGTRPSDQPVGTVVASDPGGGDTTTRGATVTVYTSDGTEKDVTAPNVVGQPSASAVAAFVGQGFSADSIEFAYTNAGVPGGAAADCRVVASDPAAGSSAPTTDGVTLTLYSSTGAAPAAGCPR
jgi:membrane peptidoglycan carboxypeptidase